MATTDRGRGPLDEDGVPIGAAVVPGRITMALDARGLYGPDVDTACGGVEPDVDDWETGRATPSREQVRLLAALCGLPVALFYEPMEPEGTVFICSRRGPKGKRCQAVSSIPVPPAADGPDARQGALW